MDAFLSCTIQNLPHRSSTPTSIFHPNIELSPQHRSFTSLRRTSHSPPVFRTLPTFAEAEFTSVRNPITKQYSVRASRGITIEGIGYRFSDFSDFN